MVWSVRQLIVTPPGKINDGNIEVVGTFDFAAGLVKRPDPDNL